MCVKVDEIRSFGGVKCVQNLLMTFLPIGGAMNPNQELANLQRERGGGG